MSAGCGPALLIRPGPTTLTVAPPSTGEGGQLELTYSAPTENSITRFEYRYWKGEDIQNEGRWEPILNSGEGQAAYSSEVISLLDTSTEYTFQVRARDGSGWGTPSHKVSATTLAHEPSVHDLSVSSHASHSEYYGVQKRVVFRAQPAYNTAANRHHGILLSIEGVFPEQDYWKEDDRRPPADAGIQVELSDTFRVAVRLKLATDSDYETAGPDLSDASLTHLRIVVGEGDEFLPINLRLVETSPTEPYEGTVSDPDFRAAITRFFDRTNREGSNPFWIMVIDTRKAIPVNVSPSAHPTMSYSPAVIQERGEEVTGTLSDTSDLNQFLDGPYYVWQARHTYGYGETWEFTVHQGRTLTIPLNADIGSEWRLCWMRHNLIEFPTSYITATGEEPTCEYSNLNPNRGETITVTLSYSSRDLTDFLWQVQTHSGTTWSDITSATDFSYTIPTDAVHGTKYRFGWRRRVYVSGGFIREREWATTHATVMVAGHGAPSEVRNLRVSEVANEIILLWDAPDNLGQGANIKYKSKRLGVSGVSIFSNRTFTYINLTNGTEYRFEVWASNEYGDGPKTTITGTPGSVSFTLTGLSTIRGDHRITLRWDEGDGNGHAITGYEVRVDTEDVISLPATARAYVFTGLTNLQNYSLQARAVNDLGHSPWSSVTQSPVSGSGNVRNDNGALIIRDIDYVPAHGTYTVPTSYDLGRVFLVRAAVYLDAGAENTASGTQGNFDSEPGLFDDALGYFDGLTALTEYDEVDAYCEVRYRNRERDDWSAWQRLTIAYLTGRYFQARIILTTTIAHLRPRVSVFRFRLSLPLRTESGEITTSNTDVVASYANHFYEPPSVVVSSPDLQPNEVIVLDNESEDEFHVRVQDEHASRHVRKVYWIATGYGEEP